MRESASCTNSCGTDGKPTLQSSDFRISRLKHQPTFFELSKTTARSFRLLVIRKESAGPRWQYAPGNSRTGLRVHAATLICRIAGPFLQVAGHLLGTRSSCSAREIDRGCCSHWGVSRPRILGFRVANACADLERAQRSLSGENVQTGDKEIARAR